MLNLAENDGLDTVVMESKSCDPTMQVIHGTASILVSEVIDDALHLIHRSIDHIAGDVARVVVAASIRSACTSYLQ